MKIIKPDPVDVLVRLFKPDSRPALALGILKVFALAVREDARVEPLPAVWPLVKLALGKEPLDSGLPKARGEFLAYGCAYPPAGFARQPLRVEVSVGGVGKELAVFGDRQFDLLGVSSPQAFSRVAISPKNAFGGEGFADNPLGKGVAALAADPASGKAERWPLPNVENPAQPIVHRGDSASPAGFWALAPDAPARMRLLGRFDKRWQQTRWPHLPLDTSPDYFQAAPADQRFPGWLRGDEKIAMRNMHPQFALVESALPGLRARCFLNRQGAAMGGRAGDQAVGAGFTEAPAHAETVWLFPEYDCGLILFRALAPVNDEDGDDVDHVFIELERLDQPLLPVAHYWQRFQEELGLATTEEIAPPDAVEPSAEPLGVAAALPAAEMLATPPAPPPSPELLELQEMTAQIDAQVKSMMAQHGLTLADLEKHMPKPVVDEAPMSLADLEKLAGEIDGQTQQMMAKHGLTAADVAKHLPAAVDEPAGGLGELKTLMQQVEHETQAMVKNSGLSPAQLKAALADHPELAGLADDALAAPNPGALDKLFAELAALTPAIPAPPPAAEAAPAEAPAEPPPPAAPVRLDRAGVIARHAAGKSLAACELSGLDLSDLDLSGADFSGALLAGATFKGSLLSATKFSDAVLQNADFSAATLDSASLAGASADGATFVDSRLRNCDASNGDFSGGDFSGADLTQANLNGAVFAGARMTGVTAGGCLADKASFEDCDLSGASFAKAVFNGARFNGAGLRQADFAGAHGEKAEFFNVDARGANFAAANLSASRAEATSVFSEANFRDATLVDVNWGGAVLSRATLSEAMLDQADLSHSQLDGASLLRASAKAANFDKANLDGADLSGINLFEGSLRLTRLGSARLQMANLYGVNFYGTSPSATCILGSNIDNTLLGMKRV